MTEIKGINFHGMYFIKGKELRLHVEIDGELKSLAKGDHISKEYKIFGLKVSPGDYFYENGDNEFAEIILLNIITLEIKTIPSFWINGLNNCSYIEQTIELNN